MYIVERLAQHAQQTPEKLAVVFEDREVTYAELWNKTVRLAHLFKELGVSDGGRVILQGKYDTFFVAGVFASHLCGAAAVPVDKDASNEMIAQLFAQVDASLVLYGNPEPLAHGLRFSELEEALPEDDSMEGLSFPGADSVAEIMFTTGTTGAPKGVQLTQKNMLARALAQIKEYGDTRGDVFVTFVPLNHVAPIMIMNLTVYRGHTSIFMTSITKIKLLFSYMDRYGVTTMYLPPSGITVIQRLAGNKLANYADQLMCVSTSSAAMTLQQREFLRKTLPNTHLYFSYASSEAGFISLYRYGVGSAGDKDITCCGKPFATADVQVVDDDFQPVPAGQIGLVAVKGDMVMPGYYKLPELNEEAFHNGYFASSDMGYFDQDGYLYLSGRKDDMINIGGLKVYPSEVENAALRIPGVAECICFGISDAVTGQGIKLLIKPGDTSSVTIPQVQEELSKSMDYYKVPKSIELVTEIQKTANGKPDRNYYKAIE